MEEKTISEKESLELISQMIFKTRRNILGGNVFLYLGGALVTSSIIFSLLLVLFETAYLMFTSVAIICLWNIAVIYFIRKAVYQTGSVLTYSDNMIKNTWDEISFVGIGVSCLFLLYSLFKSNQVLEHMWIVPYSEGLLLLVGSKITGQIVKLKAVTIDRMGAGFSAFFGVFLLVLDIKAPYEYMSVSLMMLTIATATSVVALGIGLRRKQNTKK